ncbi:palmitoyltransferase DHHC11, putative [Plasmodium ovale]|uniref:Palmitoyltransferase n=1 Tax=Plasmodium ovale TaxID=36330 RepID=A0A1D3RD45_PLAOA|nr:palmitoyltransferase DHHC11, putative [Plasmodium ovale]
MKISIKKAFLTLYKYVCILLIYVLIFQATYLCSKFASSFAIKIKIISLLSFWLTAYLTLWCHIKCLVQNPGFLSESECCEQNPGEHDANVSRCTKCNLPKIRRAHHCSACGRCVIKMDHHCLWINGCVGMYNQKFFILLNFCVLTKMDFFLIIVNTIGSLMFGMFTFVMLVDQFCGIRTNTTGIEVLKNVRGQTKPLRESLAEVFGHPFSYLWFLPVNANATQDSLAKIK